MKSININGQDAIAAQNYMQGDAVFLEVVNLTAGSITITASVSGKQFEVMKFDDGTDMAFTAGDDTMQATLPKGNYIVIAEGSDDVNDDVEIVLR
ncbi:MAG: hypothetical protein LBL00_07875 [Endomicrobium sp.]|jgi:hypothetical protein|nr:hypothetical protein [Endomicrobium sp.]